ncbi:UNVERIFIED_CONTAM: hypothetical protein RMT77_001319 [Armadillidium vulgare]
MKKVHKRRCIYAIAILITSLFMVYLLFNDFTQVNINSPKTFFSELQGNNFSSDSKTSLFNTTNILSPGDKLIPIPNINFDHERKSRLLWSSDENCKNFTVQFGKNLPLAYLISFPRSGNTWTRYLIEATTGLATGSIYTSDLLIKMGYLGESENPYDGTVLIVKSHRFVAYSKSLDDIYEYEIPVVLLIRNPQRSFLSFWNYLKTKRSFNESVHLSKKSRNFRAYTNFAKRQIPKWNKIYSKYLQSCKKLLVIFYENIIKNPIGEVTKIVEFLGYRPDDKRLECVKKHIQGPAKRNHSEELPINRKLFVATSKAVQNVLKLLRERNIKPPDEYGKCFRLNSGFESRCRGI